MNQLQSYCYILPAQSKLDLELVVSLIAEVIGLPNSSGTGMSLAMWLNTGFIQRQLAHLQKTV